MPIKKVKLQWDTTLGSLWWLSSGKKVTSVGKDVETLEPAYIAAENVKWCSHFGRQLGSSSKY